MRSRAWWRTAPSMRASRRTRTRPPAASWTNTGQCELDRAQPRAAGAHHSQGGNEIVRQQDAFFTYGVAHLRPLNLKIICGCGAAARIDHQPRDCQQIHGDPARAVRDEVFLLDRHCRSDGGASVSAEAVRFRIKQLIEAEEAQAILSDDAIVDKLKDMGIDIARRTVASIGKASALPRRPSAAARSSRPCRVRRRVERTLGTMPRPGRDYAFRLTTAPPAGRSLPYRRRGNRWREQGVEHGNPCIRQEHRSG